MRLGIIGAGNVGGVLGRRWAVLGHTIIFGVSAPSDPRHASFAGLENIKVASALEAAQASDVIVLAVPWNVAAEAVRGLGPLGDRIVIDCTNPVEVSASGVRLVDVQANSGVELLATSAQGGRFVKALNQVGANIMADPSLDSAAAAMFVAGDDDAAKALASALCSDLGFEPRDAGALRNARALEGLAVLWIHQASIGPNGRDFAWALVKARPNAD